MIVHTDALGLAVSQENLTNMSHGDREWAGLTEFQVTESRYYAHRQGKIETTNNGCFIVTQPLSASPCRLDWRALNEHGNEKDHCSRDGHSYQEDEEESSALVGGKAEQGGAYAGLSKSPGADIKQMPGKDELREQG